MRVPPAREPRNFFVSPGEGRALGRDQFNGKFEARAGHGRSMKSGLVKTLQDMVVRCLRAELRGEPLSV